MIRWTKKRLIYLAGLVDGRGTVGMIKTGYRQYRYPAIRMCFIKKRWDLLDKLQDMYGGSISNCDTLGERRYWQVQGQKAIALLEKLLPHVKSAKRKREIKKVLKEAVRGRRKQKRIS